MFVGFYGISTFVGYLMPNPFYVNNLFYLKQVKQLYVTILFQKIQLSISTQFKCKYGLIVKNISISSYSV